MPSQSISFVVYRAKNLSNGRIYVGITRTSLEKRIKAHVSATDRTAFHLAIKKYGINNFEFSIIETAADWSDLQEKERYWIKTLGSMAPNGYNLTQGGDGLVNPSLEVRDKIRRAQTGKHATDETKKKMSLSQRGRKHSNESKQKMSLGRIGMRFSDEHRQHISDFQKGKKRGPLPLETRRKIGAIHKGRRLSPAHREIAVKNLDNGRLWAKGKTFSEEHRRKLSESHKGKKQSPELIAKRFAWRTRREGGE